MIAIIDYDAGNTYNVIKALDYIGTDAVLTADADTILEADGILLPGVGAFKAAVEVLENRGLIEILREAVRRDIPLLGICLGMQLLFDESEEYGKTRGLGLIPGTVRALPKHQGLRVPHMGWNKNEVRHRNSLFHDVDEQYTYFVHSYYVDTDPSYITSTASYGLDVPAIVESGSVYGMQFHPEKSGAVGLDLLRTFTTTAAKHGTTDI